MKWWSALLVLLMLVGCAQKAEPVRSDPSPAQPGPAQPGPAQPGPAQPGPAQPTRQAVPGGFRVGPLTEPSGLRWLGPDRLAVSHKQGDAWVTEAVSIAGGDLAPLPPEPALPFHGASRASPDGKRVVLYGKRGAGLLHNLETGEERRLPVGYWGSAGFDAWSPDGARYLVQSSRTDPVPGFYFFDPDGNLLSTFAEPGHFSLWASWSPDGARVAFLSVPLETRYPRSPEEWEETPFAPRVGVLDLATGKARYGALAEQTFFGTPLWSPDGKQLAVICGDVAVVSNAPPFEQHKTTTLQNSRPCLIDPAAMTVAPVGEPLELALKHPLHLGSWTPDGSALLVRFYDEPAWQHRLILLADGAARPLPGEGEWVGGGLVVQQRASSADYLFLVGPTGEVRQILSASGRITQVAVSPDQRLVAFLHSTGGQADLVVLEPERLAPVSPLQLAPGVRALLWLEDGALLLTDPAGRELLYRWSGAVEVVGLREVGAPYPILLMMVTGGGSMGMYYEAYLYDPADARLRRINWGDSSFGVSRSPIEQVDGGLQTTHREAEGQGWRERSSIWRYRDGGLHPEAP